MAVVAILGLGLIGGSIALDLAESHEIRGFEPDPQNREQAAGAKIPVFDTPRAAVAGVDLAILCAPLAMLPSLIDAVAPHCDGNTIVTDVGGIKQPIVAAACRHVPDGGFVGGHPMAGSTERGFQAARRRLFEDAPWALTPETPAQQASSSRIQEILAPLGAHFLELSPEAHDRTVAFTSHLPYLVAVALARTAHGAQRERLAGIADLIGPGFKDTTRLAMTPVQLGQDMTMGNREALLDALSAFRHQIAQAEILLQGSMTQAFGTWAQSVADWRSSL